MQCQNLLCVSIFETDADRIARLQLSRLKEHPIPIWWYRRRVNIKRKQSQSDTQEDLSPFPKSWSVNYNPEKANEFRKEVGVEVLEHDEYEVDYDLPIRTTPTDESSIYSTKSQEQQKRHEQMRDEDGNCIKHPHVKLAERKRMPRLSKIFGKHHRNSSSGEGNMNQSEWNMLLEQCPECEAESTSERKRRYLSKSASRSSKVFFSIPNSRVITHEPFPATITIVESHPDLPVGSLALQIRTDPCPIEKSRHLSCTFDDSDGNQNEHEKWSTPDGALDFTIPCTSDGTVLPSTDNTTSEQSTDNQSIPQHQIMERIIPLSSIDHVSRGGDAWDVLRESMGENDLGCNCDLKIHGFSDRLLRFDVIGFNVNIPSKEPTIRYSFAVVDFIRKSISHISQNDDKLDASGASKEQSNPPGTYNIDEVLTVLNSLVMWERERRELGVEGWTDCFTNCLDEYLSLGVPSTQKESNPVVKKKRHHEFHWLK